MHLKEVTCLKCSVIIGRKVGLDYNSWYTCLPLICTSDDLQVVNVERERERVGERVRDCRVFAHKFFVLAWFLRISKHNVMVSQSILLQLLPMRTQNPNLSCASAFVRKVGHSTVLTLCVHTLLNWRNILSWIPFGSDLDPNRVCKCRERERERETGAGTSK